MEHSKRIEFLIGRIRTCGLLLDVGCDHGYVCIEAVQRGRAACAVAADVAKDPLAAAKEHIRARGLADRIQTLLSDGLLGLEEQPDCILIAGMGGRLMADILLGRQTYGSLPGAKPGVKPEAMNGSIRVRNRLRGAKQILLSPQSDLPLVRRTLIETLGLCIADEHMLKEDGKYYVILDVRGYGEGHSEGDSEGHNEGYSKGYGEGHSIQDADFWDAVDLAYGKRLLASGDPLVRDWLQDQLVKKKQALLKAEQGVSEKAKEQCSALETEISALKTALERAGAEN